MMSPAVLLVLRWLLLAVTVAGAVPMRICTCGASLHLHGSPFRLLDVLTPRPAPPPDTPTVTLDDLQPLEQHDPDCHLVRPRPLMSVGLLATVPELPQQALTALLPVVVVFEPFLPDLQGGGIVRLPHPPPDWPSQPLHLILCQLRN